MKCPECGIEIASLPCWRCQRQAADHEWEMRELAAEFSLVRGAPQTDESRASLDVALMRVRQHLDKERFQGNLSYNPNDLLRSRHWWYIPFGWIGCRGFIVNSHNGVVNWLGSALSLRDCFWGHEHGIVHDLVDFTFASDTPRELAARLLKRFKHLHPDARGVSPDRPVWYQESELPAALSSQFPTFRRHFVWHAIPELFEAHEKAALRFTCVLSAESN